MNFLGDWFRRHFADPQTVFLSVFLVLAFTIVITMGEMLAPVLASIVIAYLLEGLVGIMEKRGSRRLTAVLLVFLAFTVFVLFLLLLLTPLVWQQAVDLFGELPANIEAGQAKLKELPQHYPYISEARIDDVVVLINDKITLLTERIVSFSIKSIPGLITVLIYLILVPVLVFFFLKDKQRIMVWFLGFLPKERSLGTQVWREVDQQLGNYVRGKFWEIVIVGVVSYTTFALMGLKYAMLLGVLVGLSVLIPYIGAAIVTIPVALIAYFQWGWGAEFGWLLFAYAIIQALDGNVLVPLLFSEVVNLHPVAIIVAVLVFGGLWGVLGVFFAIPLATLVNAILSAWPRQQAPLSEEDSGD